MIYSSQRAKTIQKKDFTYLGAGIHDNVKLTNVRVDESVQGNKFIEFTFTDDIGRSMTHTEWEPTLGPNMTENDLQAKCDNQFKRIDQILECFYPNEEDRMFTGSSFADFANWILYMLNKADRETLLRIKAVYNQRGYVTLPRYAKYTFIEPMSKVNEGKSVITKLNIDDFEKPIVADDETKEEESIDKLPF